MKISRSAGYGMVAVGYIARNEKDGPVLSSNISKEYKLPTEYLLKILQQLVKVNILCSKRGPHGGFTMARPPKAINLLEIIEAITGPVAGPLSMAEQTGGASFSVKMERVCQRATASAEAVLRKTKLSDLIGATSEKRPRKTKKS